MHAAAAALERGEEHRGQTFSVSAGLLHHRNLLHTFADQVLGDGGALHQSGGAVRQSRPGSLSVADGVSTPVRAGLVAAGDITSVPKSFTALYTARVSGELDGPTMAGTPMRSAR